MGYNIVVYVVAIGAVLLMTSPTEGNYLRIGKDPRHTDAHTTMAKSDWSITSPTKGSTYLRRFEDGYEKHPLFLEFPRHTDEYTTKREWSVTSPTKGSTYLRRFEDGYEKHPLFLEFPRHTDEYTTKREWSVTKGPPPEHNPNGPTKREEEVTDEPNYDEQREPLYLPVALMMAKDYLE